MNKLLFTDQVLNSIRINARRPCLAIKRNGQYTSWNYKEFGEDLNKLTGILKQNGIKKDVNALVIGENTPEWLISYMSIVFAGGNSVPVDPNIPEFEIKEILSITSPRVVFCSPTFVSLFKSLRDEFFCIEHIIVLDIVGLDGEPSFYEFKDMWKDKLSTLKDEFKPEDSMAIIFTSGTTGKAKGVLLNQKNLTSVYNDGVPRMQVDSSYSALVVLPLHHVFGFAACVGAGLSTGFELVFIPVPKGPAIIEALKDNKISLMPAVPQILELFYLNIERTVISKGQLFLTIFNLLKIISKLFGKYLGNDFKRKLFSSVHEGFGGNLKLIISGGSALKQNYFDGFDIMGFNIVEGYGLTETFGPITICPRNDRRQSSVGPVFGNNLMKIDNPNLKGIGEVCFKGDTVFSGYYNNIEATKKVFDDDGWFRTGDLGRIDDDGFLFLSGRIKDLIVLPSGKNVYPDELEDHYLQSPEIEDIAIFAKEENGNEKVVAVILANKDIRKVYDSNEVFEKIKMALLNIDKGFPNYKKISDFVLSTTFLPRTSTKKLKKPELLKFYNVQKKGEFVNAKLEKILSVPEQKLADSNEFYIFKDAILSLFPLMDKSKIDVRSYLDLDLSLDSLRKIELLSLLEEKLNFTIPEDRFALIETVLELIQLLKDLSLESDKKLLIKTKNLKDRISGNSNDFSNLNNGGLVLSILPSLSIAICKGLYSLSVDGSKNIDTSKPIIFCCNHSSFLDAAWLLGSLPLNIRNKTFSVGKAELLNYPILGSLMKNANFISVNRANDFIETLKVSLGLLNSGRNLLIFPEGTRSRNGEIGDFKYGIGMLALESDANIIPVKINGAYDIWAAGKSPKILAAKSIDASIKFGDAISVASIIEMRNRTKYDITAEIITEFVKDIIIKL